jgi:methylated-DNA-[protein]-cysteine S-methyltransferase
MNRSRTPVFVAQALIDSPLGPIRLAATVQGLAGAWFEGQQHHPGEIGVPVDTRHPVLQRAGEQLSAYFAGKRADFDLPLDPQGTPFQQAVWQALRRIPRGATCSYGDIAQSAGRPAAVRAAGAAIGRNPVSIIVPCHRVIGRDGSLTGYAGGLARKTALLTIEGVLPAATLHPTPAQRPLQWLPTAA